MLHANAKSRRMLPRVGYRTHPDDPGHLDPGSSQGDHGFGDGGSGGDDIVHDEDGPGRRRADPQSARHVAPTVGSIQRLLRSAPALPGKRPSHLRPGRPGQDQLEGSNPVPATTGWSPEPGRAGPVRREHRPSSRPNGSAAALMCRSRAPTGARAPLPVRNCGVNGTPAIGAWGGRGGIAATQGSHHHAPGRPQHTHGRAAPAPERRRAHCATESCHSLGGRDGQCQRGVTDGDGSGPRSVGEDGNRSVKRQPAPGWPSPSGRRRATGRPPARSPARARSRPASAGGRDRPARTVRRPVRPRHCPNRPRGR